MKSLLLPMHGGLCTTTRRMLCGLVWTSGTHEQAQMSKAGQEHIAPAGRTATEMPGISRSFS